jgi:prepilin-type N-terminal cleavage/methylation domain-containing protein
MRRKCSGFTLLEMLFVMFVVGLLVGLIAPRFASRIDAIERFSQRQELEDQLRQLPRRVRLAGRGIELPKDVALANLGDGEPVLKVPEGWAVGFEPPLMIGVNGACSASSVSLTTPEPKELPSRYRIAELSCELSPVNP